jgi:hypothetical protein
MYIFASLVGAEEQGMDLEHSTFWSLKNHGWRIAEFLVFPSQTFESVRRADRWLGFS